MPCSLYSWNVSVLAVSQIDLDFTHVDDAQGLVDGGLCVEREARVNLGGNLAGDNVQDLLAELDKEVVQCRIDLVVDVVGVLLAPGNGGIDELCVLGLLGGRENQGGVGGCVLGLVLVDGRKVTRVADDGLSASVSSQTQSRTRAQLAVVGLPTVPEAFNWSREEDIVRVCV